MILYARMKANRPAVVWHGTHGNGRAQAILLPCQVRGDTSSIFHLRIGSSPRRVKASQSWSHPVKVEKISRPPWTRWRFPFRVSMDDRLLKNDMRPRQSELIRPNPSKKISQPASVHPKMSVFIHLVIQPPRSHRYQRFWKSAAHQSAASAFNLRISFGFRPSGFGFQTKSN